MTCIVAIEHAGKVYIGGDSAGSNERFHLTVRADEKVFRNGDFFMGFTSSFRMGQILRYRFTPPAHPKGTPNVEYMNTLLVDAARECLKEYGFAKQSSGEESGGTFIV